MPKSVKFAVGGVVFQAVMNALVGFLLMALASDEADHGGDGAGFLQFIGLLSVAISLLLAVCAALSGKRLGWVRTTVVVIEVVSIASSVFALFSGSIPSVLGILIAGAIIRAFVSAEGKAWFSA
ncbi:hypothetical protein [Kitasatospora camelliae]|uniref:Uncharacterized protein n=1 Tax=Kitasatospora camelliae TaxID=3156397 RepID=A0AAU8JRS9_9ACTN